MVTKRRALSVIGGLAFAFSTIIFAPLGVFSVITELITLLAFNEFLWMYHVNDDIGLYTISMAVFAIQSIAFLFPPLRSPGGALTLTPLTILTIALITQQIEEKNFGQILVILLGTAYVSFLLYYLVLLRAMPDGRELMIVLAIGTFGRNLGALVSGHLIRRGHTMLPKVSPRKTYEGTVGGLVFTLLIVSLSGHWLLPVLNLGDLIAISFLIGTLGQVGDLVESWLKRNASVINSGQILPGQGGILDSVDSLIFTAPALYFYIVIRMSVAGLHV